MIRFSDLDAGLAVQGSLHDNPVIMKDIILLFKKSGMYWLS